MYASHELMAYRGPVLGAVCQHIRFLERKTRCDRVSVKLGHIAWVTLGCASDPSLGPLYPLCGLPLCGGKGDLERGIPTARFSLTHL